MGTSNFHTANADKTYVVDYGDDQYMWEECNEYIGDHILEIIKEDNEQAKTKDKVYFTKCEDQTSHEELRSFPTSSIGYFEFSDDFLGVDIEVKVTVFIRSGYYSAANLDWELVVNYNSCEYEDYDNFDEECFILDNDIAQSTWNLHGTKFIPRVKALVLEATNKAEELFEKVSTPYNVSAQFNNGETHYTLA